MKKQLREYNDEGVEEIEDLEDNNLFDQRNEYLIRYTFNFAEILE